MKTDVSSYACAGLKGGVKRGPSLEASHCRTPCRLELPPDFPRPDLTIPKGMQSGWRQAIRSFSLRVSSRASGCCAAGPKGWLGKGCDMVCGCECSHFHLPILQQVYPRCWLKESFIWGGVSMPPELFPIPLPLFMEEIWSQLAGFQGIFCFVYLLCKQMGAETDRSKPLVFYDHLIKKLSQNNIFSHRNQKKIIHFCFIFIVFYLIILFYCVKLFPGWYTKLNKGLLLSVSPSICKINQSLYYGHKPE